MADPSPVTSSSESRPVERLERNVLTVPNGIALAAAAMAPVIAVVLNAPAAGPSAGPRSHSPSYWPLLPACW